MKLILTTIATLMTSAALACPSQTSVDGTGAARCIPTPGVVKAKVHTGKSSLTRYVVDASVLALTVTGDSAREIFNDVNSVEGSYELSEHGDSPSVFQTVGENVSCLRISKKVKGKTVLEYSCDINLRKGKALPGAAG